MLFFGVLLQVEFLGDEGCGRGDEGVCEGVGYVEVIEVQGFGCLGFGREFWNVFFVFEYGYYMGYGGVSCDCVLGV